MSATIQVIEQESIPDSEIRLLALPLVDTVQKYFENPEVQADFERWRANRTNEN